MREKIEALAKKWWNLPIPAREKELQKAFPDLKTWIIQEKDYFYYCVQDDRCVLMVGFTPAPVPSFACMERSP